MRRIQTTAILPLTILLCVVLGSQPAFGQGLLDKFFSGVRLSPQETADKGESPQVAASEQSPAENGLRDAASDLAQVETELSDSTRDIDDAVDKVRQLLPGSTPRELPDEPLPAPAERIHIPLTEIGTPGEVKINRTQNGRISLVVRDASLSRVLSLFAQSIHLNIVAANDIDAVVSITLNDVPVEQALSAILSVANYTWVTHNGIIYITNIADATRLPADVQGRQIQVFPLDYVSGTAVSEAVQGFLSPVGQVFFTEGDEADNRKTQESVVVEDLPHALSRIATFIHQIDQPPRQVQIEVHILQVDLKDSRHHGVNFEHLFSVMGNNVSISTVGLAASGATQAFFASIKDGNLTALVEALKTTTDAKTLASPKITVLNEQTAKLHVGEQLGYRVTTTTETSTLESIDFLDVGVVLTITPRISRDNRVLLNVKPEVSSGQINPDTGVPEEETTELETSVMLDDGYGMVIGGLIQETDSIIQSKVPYIGDLWMVGRLFQRQVVLKDRSEIIVVLIPRVQPLCGVDASHEQGEIARAGTPLFEGPLLRRTRPWNPRLPDAVTNPRMVRFPPVGRHYPYPAREVEYAGTPQPQTGYYVPPRPGPALRDGEHPGCYARQYGEEIYLENPALPMPSQPEYMPDEYLPTQPIQVEPADLGVSLKPQADNRSTALAWWGQPPQDTLRVRSTSAIAPTARTVRSATSPRIVRLPPVGVTKR